MRNNETGEFELVVGNGQLLSGFFIVILLCAVMFAMGFVVARAKYQQDAANNNSAPTGAGSVRQQAAVSAAQPIAAPTPPADTMAPPPEAGAPPDTPASTAGKAIPDNAPLDAASPPQEAVPAADGTYWQVIATANQESLRTMLKTLKDQGFPASLSPGPNGLTRVLVGPYSDTGSMGRAKTELESAGFHTVKH